MENWLLFEYAATSSREEEPMHSFMDRGGPQGGLEVRCEEDPKRRELSPPRMGIERNSFETVHFVPWRL